MACYAGAYLIFAMGKEPDMSTFGWWVLLSLLMTIGNVFGDIRRELD